MSSGEGRLHGRPVGPSVTGWTPRPYPEPVTLRGDYVEVRPLTSAAYADLYAATCGAEDDDLWVYRPVPRPTSLPTLWMHLADQVESEDRVAFALVPLEGESAGRAAGVASFLNVHQSHGSLELGGVLFGRSLQRTRAATEAVHLLMTHALDDLGYRRFEWKCDTLNEPSRRAATRLGFTEEGRFRRHMVTQGRSRDTDWFSVVDDEWPALREAHRRWLSPDNFDGAGRQATRLADLLPAPPTSS